MAIKISQIKSEKLKNLAIQIDEEKPSTIFGIERKRINQNNKVLDDGYEMSRFYSETQNMTISESDKKELSHIMQQEDNTKSKARKFMDFVTGKTLCEDIFGKHSNVTKFLYPVIEKTEIVRNN